MGMIIAQPDLNLNFENDGMRQCLKNVHKYDVFGTEFRRAQNRKYRGCRRSPGIYLQRGLSLVDFADQHIAGDIHGDGDGC